MIIIKMKIKQTMKRFKLLSVILLVFLFGCSTKNIQNVDVCIYGGTSAGVIAAYTASLSGKKVLLIEPGRNLGGMSSGGLGYTDIGNKFVVTGLSRDFYRRVGKHYGKFEQWIFEPSVAENVYNDYIKRENIEVLYLYRLNGVNKSGNKIDEIIVENSATPQSSTNIKVKAKVFIDCSYEGDLMAKAGASYSVGREDNSVYGETYNGVQVMKGHQFWDPIDPYIVPGDSASGLIWGVSGNKLGPAGSGDTKIQAYNFRVCLTDSVENRIPIIKPDNYDPKKYELALRLHDVSPRKSVYSYFIWSNMPNRKTDINNGGGISTDMIGMNWDYPEGDYARRAEIWKAHEDYTKGLFYFLGHDERIPEFMRKEMLKWGYPKDEYVNNNNWSHQLYVRESRRMIGELVMTEHHCTGKEVIDDVVGWAAYTMDSHNCDRIVIDGSVKNEGNVEIGDFPPYPISYRAITPRRDEVANLLVPVCLSASHIAYGSIRMEPVFMVLAQSAAVAACIAIDGNTNVQDVDVKNLQNILKNNPLADDSTPEILIDNDDRESVQTSGNWSISNDTFRGYGLNFLIDDSKGNTLKTIRYTPEIRVAGNYDIYIFLPGLEEASTYTDVSVFNGMKRMVKQVHKDDIKVEGQTGGEWINIGSFTLNKGKDAYIEISNKGADNVVAADAVLFLPAKE